MVKLLIVESPAKAKVINKYLGDDYAVVASFGHVRDLPSKNGSVDHLNDFAMVYEVTGANEKHLKPIIQLARNAESILIATDPDREGENIAWHIEQILRERKVIKSNIIIKRVVFNEITKTAVKDGVANPRMIDMSLVEAGLARRALDYLVGFNLSPVLWRKLPGSRSAGRVQSVALRLISEREDEIAIFVAQEYWTISGLFTTDSKELTANLVALNGKKLEKFSVANKEQADQILNEISSYQYAVSDIAKKKVNRQPAAPFITSTLQQEASNRLGFSASKTMQVAQKLYEGINLGGETTGLITYMRTDGLTVAKEAVQQTRDLIAKTFGADYIPSQPRVYQSKVKNAQEAHEAIRPTNPNLVPEKVRQYLDGDQFALYKMIWTRLIASQMSNAILAQTTISISGGTAEFRATGSIIEFPGFFAVLGKGDEEEAIMPSFDQGQKLDHKKIKSAQHFTEPAPRYNEASLIKKMEELGIGRPSTYASVISVLQDRAYVKLEKRRFFLEERGRLVTAFLVQFFPKYVEYDFTASLENDLDKIASSELNWKKFLHSFWHDFHGNVTEAMEIPITDVIAFLSTKLTPYLFGFDDNGEIKDKCPTCASGKLSLKLSRFGAFIGCSGYPTCRYTKNFSGEGMEEAMTYQEPSQLGEEITLRQGPYGFYVQLGEAIEVPAAKKGKMKTIKPKRASLPAGMSPDEVDLNVAKALLALPRVIGLHPETSEPITAGIGRFGPYIQYQGKYTSLKEDSALTIEVVRATEILNNKGVAKGLLRSLGIDPAGISVAIYDGRYGAYIKHGKSNVAIPKTINHNELDLSTALKIIKKKSDGDGTIVKKKRG